MKSFAKLLARLFFRILALPVWVSYQVSSRILDPDKAFHGATQALATVPGVPGEYLRREFLCMTLEECAPDCCISFGTVLSKRGARIGRRVYVGTHCTLGLVTLGDDVLLASNVDVISGTGQHRFDDPEIPVREQGGSFERVAIGADTWIGNRTVVMASVGEQCVIGAGSVVNKPLEARSIAVGSPARVVGTRGPAE